MRIPVRLRRASAPLAIVCAVGFAAALGGVDSARAGPDLAPGFCAAPSKSRVGDDGSAASVGAPWGEFSIATVGRSTVQRAVFVDCQELGEWRRGERKRFSHYGVVTLYRGEDLVAEAFPALARGLQPGEAWRSGRIETADTPKKVAGDGRAPIGEAQEGLVQERVSGGVLYRTRLLEKGAALPSEPSTAAEGDGAVARAEGLTLHLSGACLSAAGDAAIERSIVMPYRNDDTLRYVQAALLAGVTADRIALMSLR